MSEPRRFRVVYEPDEAGTWQAYIPDVKGCRTWGRSIGEARRHVREALATCIDVLGERAETIARTAVFVERYELTASARREIREYLNVKKKAEALAKREGQLASAAAFTLTKKAHLSLRDAGAILGLSHERVSQVLVKRGRVASTRARTEPRPVRGRRSKVAKKGPQSRARAKAVA